MPLKPGIEDKIPAWTLSVEDDCARGLIRSFFATVLMAMDAGVQKHPSCLRMLERGRADVPSEKEIKAARGNAALNSVCERISKAERLVSRAEYCAERRSK